MTPRGGPRQNAGRKPGPLGPAEPLAVRVPARVREAIWAEARAQGKRPSALVTEILTAAMRRRGRL